MLYETLHPISVQYRHLSVSNDVHVCDISHTRITISVLSLFQLHALTCRSNTHVWYLMWL